MTILPVSVTLTVTVGSGHQEAHPVSTKKGAR